MITALISSYEEGQLLESAIRSLRAPGIHRIALFEGPVGDAADSTLRQEWIPYVTYFERGRWDDDAAKRTAMLHWAQEVHADQDAFDVPLWIFWLDGDEILLYGEYLWDWCQRADYETGAGGFAIRLVELDGSVVKAHGRVIRGDLIDSYLMSIANVQLKNGLVVSLPNVPICDAGGVPVWRNGDRQIAVSDLAELRPPLMGEPHILHRSMLRDPSRQAVRQSEAESAWFKAQTEGLG